MPPPATLPAQAVDRQDVIRGVPSPWQRRRQDHELGREQTARIEFLTLFDRRAAQGQTRRFSRLGCFPPDDQTQRERRVPPSVRRAGW